MKLTIIPDDSFVSIDGNGSHQPLDLSPCNIPENVHALQWKNTAGWIEFQDNPDGTKPQNEEITELPTWALACVTVWNAWTPYVPPITPAIEPSTTT